MFVLYNQIDNARYIERFMAGQNPVRCTIIDDLHESCDAVIIHKHSIAYCCSVLIVPLVAYDLKVYLYLDVIPHYLDCISH